MGNKQEGKQPRGASIEEEKSLLEELLEEQKPVTAASSQEAALLVGECREEEHPTLVGRSKIVWAGPTGGEQAAWLPRIHCVIVRLGDRVLLQRPANYPEPVIMGVLDGLAPRRLAEKVPGPTVHLRQDESVRVRSEEGVDMLEVYQGEAGPVLRILNQDLDLELPGKLSVRAGSISLKAEDGSVEVDASEDVVVKGEDISLN